ncbi:MAG TPA: right-handed parallel beta-helix repeat-containing protein [Roseiflexaceae bacterium]|nr:right-handed parallel beta-helix repeat-containing protein [Roseiflexaceae bacterium]
MQLRHPIPRNTRQLLLIALLLAVQTLCSALPGVHAQEAIATSCTISEDITGDETWSPEICATYLVTRSFTIGFDGRLTILPGTIVRFDPKTGLVVEGMLVARGTPERPITFDSSQPDPRPGDWTGVRFASNSVDTRFDDAGNYLDGSMMQYVTIAHGGGEQLLDPEANLALTSTTVYIDHVTVTNSATAGIHVESDDPLRITNNVITDNEGSGMYVSTNKLYFDPPIPSIIDGNTVSRNKSNGIWVLASRDTVISHNTVEENEYGGMKVDGLPLFPAYITITNNLIADNFFSEDDRLTCGGGIHGLRSIFSIESNIITGNTADTGGGVCTTSSAAQMHDNLFAENRAGNANSIYIADAFDTTITGNDILSAGCMPQVELANDSNAAIDATDNYWGVLDGSAVEALILHFTDDRDLGLVRYAPVRYAPVREQQHTPVHCVFVPHVARGGEH